MDVIHGKSDAQLVLMGGAVVLATVQGEVTYSNKLNKIYRKVRLEAVYYPALYKRSELIQFNNFGNILIK